MYAIERKADKIYIKSLSKRDAAGNQYWIVRATISNNARIGSKRVTDCSDDEILEAATA